MLTANPLRKAPRSELEQEAEVDFSRSRYGLVTPYFPAKHAAPDDDDFPAGADMFVWDPVIGPADGGSRSAPNPMSIIGPGAAMPSLASQLNWRVPGDRKRRSTLAPRWIAQFQQELLAAPAKESSRSSGTHSAHGTSVIGT